MVKKVERKRKIVKVQKQKARGLALAVRRLPRIAAVFYCLQLLRNQVAAAAMSPTST